MKYVVYCLRLSGYLGENITSPKLLKVGISKNSANYRLEMNSRFEGNNSYRSLFENVEILAEKSFNSKEQAEEYESEILNFIGSKDCGIYEKVKGVTELRTWNQVRENKILQLLS